MINLNIYLISSIVRMKTIRQEKMEQDLDWQSQKK